mgnify:FL=1
MPDQNGKTPQVWPIMSLDVEDYLYLLAKIDWLPPEQPAGIPLEEEPAQVQQCEEATHEG